MRHFDRLVIAGLGIDRHPELRQAYFGNYRRLVYLCTVAEAGCGSAGPRNRGASRTRIRRSGTPVTATSARASLPLPIAPWLPKLHGQSLIVISWRDVPAQVVVKRGRETAKVQLSDRFQEAVDRAAMRAGRGSSDALPRGLATRSDPQPCGDDIEQEAAAEAGRSRPATPTRTSSD